MYRCYRNSFTLLTPSLCRSLPPISTAKGCLAISQLCENLVHLDYANTAGKPRRHQSGTLFEVIELWHDCKKSSYSIAPIGKTGCTPIVQVQIASIVRHLLYSCKDGGAENGEDKRRRIDMWPGQKIRASNRSRLQCAGHSLSRSCY